MNTPVTVAAAQLSPIFLDKNKTVDKACEAILEAGKNGAELLVFPEAFIPAYPDWVWLIPNSKGAVLNELYIKLVENAVSIPDKTTDRLCKSAKAAGINVVMGMNERNSETSGTSLYNSLLFINDQGIILGKHRKLIATGGERLIWAQGSGSTLRSYDTSVGKIAGLICWENYMPLARNAIYESGAQILISPTWDKSTNWLQSMQHVAREGGLFVISNCMALRLDNIPDKYSFKTLYPEGREWINTGNSCIIAPNGEVLAGPLEAEEGILYASIDLQQIIASKRMFDVVGHYSRPDVFEFHLKNKKYPLKA
ncbi:carbon-nitrogen hydrolase family protein [Arenibacter sp. 6A1]|uniref:carbon-nitrogen hydrolase family protein n=1 Tax=Arenibacter sp. 6A1 TaxID=2720391 RepID=UPI001448197E|nr:carbon-nitrogen hydrolase family protein [Arenibacter sp. 6A1]NKI27135.1 carbon-nitrogen hydrolase family protein [Arenibacter sp. 6A1]